MYSSRLVDSFEMPNWNEDGLPSAQGRRASSVGFFDAEFRMDDPMKAARMDFESDGAFKSSLAARRTSGDMRIGSSFLPSLATRAQPVVPKPEPIETQGMTGTGYFETEAARGTDYVQSAPILANQHPMAAHWQAHSQDMLYSGIDDRKPLSHPSAMEGSHARQFDWSHELPQHPHLFQHRAGALSAPIRADGTFGSALWEGTMVSGFKRRAPEPDHHMFHGSGATMDGAPSPKKLRTMTPHGTPSQAHGTTNLWVTPPSANEIAMPPPPMLTVDPSMAIPGMPPSFGLMQMPYGGPPSGMPFSGVGFAMQGYPSAAMWPSAGVGGYPSSPIDYSGSISDGMSRRRRKSRAHGGELVPKVKRPAKGGADKWKNLSKKERERARRAELKQCYNDLSASLDMEASRTGAQLPDRSEIVRVACEEIRRLERTLATLQGSASQCQTIKEHVKATYN